MTTRTTRNVRRDLRAWLDTLHYAQRMNNAQAIAHCAREVQAMMNELIYRRYGRTDVS